MKSLLSLNPLLSDRIRLAIMVALVTSKEPLDFNILLASLEVTKGNLSTHLRKLEEGGLIIITKDFVGRKPHTTYQETKEGKKAIQEYLNTIEDVLKGVKKH